MAHLGAGDNQGPQAQHDATDAEELLQAHLHLWSHALGHVKSMALKCALDLRIPDAIHRCGGAATLDDLLATTGLPPSSLPFLRRLMRALTASRIFSLRQDHPADDPAAVSSYHLTPTSRLLLSGGDDASCFSLFPAIYPLVQEGTESPMLRMHQWMGRHDAAATSLYEMVLGKDVWDTLQASAAYTAAFQDAMDADTRLVMHAVLARSPAVFRGLTTLVDVGGGRGRAVAAIAGVFPHIQCTVMDLPHVVAEAPAGNGVCFLAGDMFEHIPSADALLLKSVLHDWDDANCIKIMQRCMEAIGGCKEGRGKVIIIDAVIGSVANDDDDDAICREAQVLCDLNIMAATNGAEREEHEWRRIFLEAGFRDYKITRIRGAGSIPSIIEVYP